MCRTGKGPAVAEVSLTEDETAKLNELARRRKTALAMALRCRIVLECAKGMGSSSIPRVLIATMPANPFFVHPRHYEALPFAGN